MESRVYTNKDMPLGIKLIALFNWILCLLFVLSGISDVIGGIGFYSGKESAISETQKLIAAPFPASLGSDISEAATSISGYFGIILISMGILTILLAGFIFIVTRNLQRREKWARKTGIILSILWILIWSVGIIVGSYEAIIMIIPVIAILAYLLFSKNLKEHFFY